MKDELPSNNTTILEKVSLSEDEIELMIALDNFYPHYGVKVKGIKASRMLEGAIFAIRRECGENPDILAQAAHSLREILYPFESDKDINYTIHKSSMHNNSEVEILDMGNNPDVPNKKQFKKTLLEDPSNSDFPNYHYYSEVITDLYKKFTKRAHHNFPQTCSNLKELRKILDEFIKIMLKAIRQRDKEVIDIENTDIGDIVPKKRTDNNE